MNTSKCGLIIPNTALAMAPAYGHELVNLAKLGIYAGIGGGARGYNTEGDIITQTTDGRDLNALWSEFQQTIAVQNAERQAIVDFLTFPVTSLIEDVPQITGDDFEEASEFGEPKSIRAALSYFSLAYDFKWYDIAARFTWKFLAEASAQQVEAVHQSVLEADNRLVFTQVMKTLFNPTNKTADIRNQSYTVYKLYNNDGTVPPSYKGNTFANTHTHYQISGAATVDSGDVDAMVEDLRKHGYSATNGVRLVLMVNPQEALAMRSWRANVANANSAIATYDFIPASNQPAFLLPGAGMIGTQVAGTLDGLAVIGSYGHVTIVEEDYIPAGYMVLIGTGGKANLNNPVGIREHANASLRGMRLVKGRDNDYPLVDSFYSRGFGTGVRQRGGAFIMQVKASGSYDTPTAYV